MIGSDFCLFYNFEITISAISILTFYYYIYHNLNPTMKKPNKRLTYDEKVSKCEEFIKNFEDY